VRRGRGVIPHWNGVLPGIGGKSDITTSSAGQDRNPRDYVSRPVFPSPRVHTRVGYVLTTVWNFPRACSLLVFY